LGTIACKLRSCDCEFPQLDHILGYSRVSEFNYDFCLCLIKCDYPYVICDVNAILDLHDPCGKSF